MMTWDETCDYMNRLIAAKSPPVIKAHWLVGSLLPRLIAQIGIDEVSHELAIRLAHGLCVQTATCTICKARKMDGTAEDADDLCCKCRAEMDQLIAEAGL